MKYLLIVIAVLAGVWWLRQQRKPDQTPTHPSGPQVMLPCAHCGTHVPEADAIRSTHGVYCSEAHRQSHEG